VTPIPATGVTIKLIPEGILLVKVLVIILREMKLRNTGNLGDDGLLESL